MQIPKICKTPISSECGWKEAIFIFKKALSIKNQVLKN